VLLVSACSPAPPATPASGSAAAASPPPRSEACPAAASPAPAAVGDGSTDRPGWWLDRVFYEVFVRSFADSNGDGVGDLAGLTAHLDYLNDGDPSTTTDLGVTGIWLMPVDEAASYHGYDTIDLAAVERDYGTLADMRALVAAAHERGIAVITDLVLNHTSDQDPWFLDAQSAGAAHRDWYVWSDTDPGYGGPDGQQVWHAAADGYYYGVFGPDLPDLNLSNPAVTSALDDAARFWLTDVGVDGFRLDAIKHLIEEGQAQVHTPSTHAWLRDFRRVVESIKPGAFLVGEVYDVTAATSRYVPEDVDQVFDFELAGATVDTIRGGRSGQYLTAAGESIGDFGPGERAMFLTNHDQDRVASRLNDDPARLALAARLLLADPGVPFVYYGEEIGLTGEKPDERIRTPMPWTGAGPAAGFTTGVPWESLEPGWEQRNVAAETSVDSSLLSVYRDAIRLRDGHPALSSGDVRLVETGNEAIVARLQEGAGEHLLLLANLGEQALADYALRLDESGLCGELRASILPTPGAEATAGDGSAAAPRVGAAGGFDGYRPLPSIPPRSLTILSLEPDGGG
jgi:glycosidase